MEEGHFIARGGFCNVHSVLYNGQLAVLKTPIEKRGSQAYKDSLRSLKREEQHLRILKGNKGIPELYDVSKGDYGIIMSYAEGQSLEGIGINPESTNPREFIQRSINTILQVTTIVQSLEPFLQSHADIKPSNIIVGNEVTLIDFGSSVAQYDVGGNSSSSGQYSLTYSAPELIKKDEVNSRTDVYSLAATLAQSLDNPPIRVDRSLELLISPFEELVLFKESSGLAKKLTSLTLASLDHNPNYRPTLQEFRDELVSL